MAKRKSDEQDRPSRAKNPDERINDARGHDREFVALRLRKELHAAIDEHRGERSWSAAAHEVIEAGLRTLGWNVKEPALSPKRNAPLRARLYVFDFWLR